MGEVLIELIGVNTPDVVCLDDRIDIAHHPRLSALEPARGLSEPRSPQTFVIEGLVAGLWWVRFAVPLCRGSGVHRVVGVGDGFLSARR